MLGKNEREMDASIIHHVMFVGFIFGERREAGPAKKQGLCDL